VVALLEAWIPPPSEGFFLYYPSRRQSLASLRALIDFDRGVAHACTAAGRALRSRLVGTPPTLATEQLRPAWEWAAHSVTIQLDCLSYKLCRL
jgi:hypothetical protein